MKIEKIEDLRAGDWVSVKGFYNEFIVIAIDYENNKLNLTSPSYLAWDFVEIHFPSFEFTLIGKTRPKFRLLYRLFGGKGGIICPFKKIPIKGNTNFEKDFLNKIS